MHYYFIFFQEALFSNVFSLVAFLFLFFCLFSTYFCKRSVTYKINYFYPPQKRILLNKWFHPNVKGLVSVISIDKIPIFTSLFFLSLREGWRDHKYSAETTFKLDKNTIKMGMGNFCVNLCIFLIHWGGLASSPIFCRHKITTKLTDVTCTATRVVELNETTLL